MRHNIIIIAAAAATLLFAPGCKKDGPANPEMPSFISVSLSQPYTVENGTRFEISVAPQADAQSYIWKLPENLQILEGEGTNSILVKCVEEGEIKPGTIKCYAVNAQGQSIQRCFWFSIDITPRVIAITTDIPGSQAVYPSTVITFTAPEVEDIVSYEWNCPEGFTAIGPLNGTSAQYSAPSTFCTIPRDAFVLKVKDSDGMESQFSFHKYIHIIDINVAKRYGKKVWTRKNLNYAGADGNLGKTRPDDPDGSKYGRYYLWGEAMTGNPGAADPYTDGDTVTDSEGNTYEVGYAARKDYGIQIQGCCPEGWHVPNAYDFYDLPDGIADDYNLRMASMKDCASSKYGIFMPANRETDPMRTMNFISNGFASSYVRGDKPQSEGGNWLRNEGTISADGKYFITGGTGDFPAGEYELYLDRDERIGFTLLPAGRLNKDGAPELFGNYSFHWTATVTGGNHYRFTVGYNTPNLSTAAIADEKVCYESVRCVANY